MEFIEVFLKPKSSFKMFLHIYIIIAADSLRSEFHLNGLNITEGITETIVVHQKQNLFC